MLKRLVTATLLLAVTTAGFAADVSNVDKRFDLKDGSTVYVFKDGKMSMEDRTGRVVSMKPGHVMETKDNQRIIMVGNELARLEVIKAIHSGGN